MKFASFCIAASLFFGVSITSYANVNPVSTIEVSHSGGTDSCGCHYNRKTGEYHCHTRKQRGNGCPP
ncbi:YHYH domain-containing protein [Vibrio breoganii]|uniref:YHYH domain-containing protein n=1 Tax=Vibrio breoganii TaxID=553239 RepID=UPI000C821C32|nr:YHYH domain-containing protein [Vibrio breoganii]